MGGAFDYGEPELASPVSGSIPMLDDLDCLLSPTSEPSITSNTAADSLPVVDTESEGIEQSLLTDHDLAQLLDIVPEPNRVESSFSVELQDASPAEMTSQDSPSLDITEMSCGAETQSTVVEPDVVELVQVPDTRTSVDTQVFLVPRVRKRTSRRSIDADHGKYANKRARKEIVEIATDAGITVPESNAIAPSELYRKRRDKNNAASKVSRAKRKEKYADQEKSMRVTEDVNSALKRKISEMEDLVKLMKRTLVKHMAQK